MRRAKKVTKQIQWKPVIVKQSGTRKNFTLTAEKLKVGQVLSDMGPAESKILSDPPRFCLTHTLARFKKFFFPYSFVYVLHVL